MTDNIYLTGFMGVGKSTVGRLLAESIGRRFVDMDETIVHQTGQPIGAIFASQGEAAFRRLESTLLRRLAGRDRLVVATGGGVPEKSENRQTMRDSGRVVYLEADLDTCLARVTGASGPVRPLWQDLESVRRLHARRRSLYAAADLTVPARQPDPELVVRAILGRLWPEDRFEVRLDQVTSPIFCAWHGPEVLALLSEGRRLAIITDRNVATRHLERYTRLRPEAPVLTLPPGEGLKSLKTAGRVWQWLLDQHLGREDLLLALGGGTVTDLGAFIAATYKRGMSFILSATTLLGAVDAAVGGKAALNLGSHKNMIGSFTAPAGVILDAASWATLGRPQIRDGLIEAYKTGLVADPDLARFIETNTKALLGRDRPALFEAARRSARAKARIVTADYRESGQRAILNFGHTFGHAVESWHRFRVSHGLAVAQGLKVAARLSAARNLLAPDQAARILSTVNQLAPDQVPLPPPDQAWELMRHDKKVKRGQLVFVLLEEPGRPLLVNDVGMEEMVSSHEFMVNTKLGTS